MDAIMAGQRESEKVRDDEYMRTRAGSEEAGDVIGDGDKGAARVGP